MTGVPCIVCDKPAAPGNGGRCLGCSKWRSRHGYDRSRYTPNPDPVSCSTDGCQRPEYLDGRCKKCADEHHYRQQTASRRPTRKAHR
jgi:hypothetical protein